MARSPLAAEAVRRIDLIFDAERAINGLSAERRLAVRQQDIAPLVVELECWMREQHAQLSRHNDLAKAIHYMLTRWAAFTAFLKDGRICLTIMRRSARCAALPSGESLGCSRGQTVAANGLRQCTPSSSPPN